MHARVGNQLRNRNSVHIYLSMFLKSFFFSFSFFGELFIVRSRVHIYFWWTISQAKERSSSKKQNKLFQFLEISEIKDNLENYNRKLLS